MKKIILLLGLLIAMLILAGCPAQTPDKPYIVDANTDRNHGVAGENVDVVVKVKNPTTIDFNGNVLIKADMPDCFGMGRLTIGTLNDVYGYIKPISVVAGETNSVLITMHIPQLDNRVVQTPTTQEKCYQPSNHKLTIFVLQSEKVLSTMEIDFALFERR